MFVILADRAGWTKFYEFSTADLRAATEVVVRLSDEAGRAKSPIRWEDVHGLLAQAVYGGRIDNTFDGRVLASYLAMYFNSDVVAETSTRRTKVVLLGPGVAVPTSAVAEDFLQVIRNLPELVRAPTAHSLLHPAPTPA